MYIYEKNNQMGDLFDDAQWAKWRKARIGLIIFGVSCFFLLAIALDKADLRNSSPLGSVVVTYFISRWYIKRQLSLGWKFKNMIVMGLSVSLVVFLFYHILAFIALFLLSR